MLSSKQVIETSQKRELSMEARMRKKVPSGRKTYRVLKAAKDDHQKGLQE